ncbi:helix-turn-helix domain-containing protein [Rhodococcus sp. ARC_M6]|uniref:helix-turn-helix domain-containing protein n=1 Tax=Rhodococcus sp. ARC_M6 TaxID=2928852 RepID=UPI001FB55003|nr:helix-turn-helix transcriptional regulator [Rhodococcus sp. ARC_M6]MCJ0906589.1 helix-turn-helix domain-containing protein [Rhodococcus sp. ARC_M6]
MDTPHKFTLVRNASEHSGTAVPAQKAPLIREAYGRVLREVRRDQDRTLGDVAAEVGMSKQYLSEVERGKKEPSSEILRSICDALGMPLEHLLFRSGNKIVALNSISFGHTPRPISGPVLMAA